MMYHLWIWFQAYVFCEAAGDPTVWQLPAQYSNHHTESQPGQGAGKILQGVFWLCKLWCPGVWKAYAYSKNPQQPWNITQSL